MNAKQLEFAFHLLVNLGSIREMDARRAGHRWFIPITGGSVSGPCTSGHI
ncbi:MAG: hypothetical protein ACRBB0_22280 [Pelagimonas sp.]